MLLPLPLFIYLPVLSNKKFYFLLPGGLYGCGWLIAVCTECVLCILSHLFKLQLPAATPAMEVRILEHDRGASDGQATLF